MPLLSGRHRSSTRRYYGQLIRGTDILPWKPEASGNADR
jgi:hypothetical protein